MPINSKQSFIGSAIAMFFALSCCWLPWLAIAVGSATGLASLSQGLEKYSGVFMALSVVLLTFGIVRYLKNRQIKMDTTQPILLSTITCPECGFQKEEKMPTDACQFFYECTSCKVVIKPKEKDCCVYCSYGTVACPPIQMDKNCCT